MRRITTFSILAIFSLALQSSPCFGLDEPDEASASEARKQSQWGEVIRLLSPYSETLSLTGLEDLATAYRHSNDFAQEARIREMIAVRNDQLYLNLYHLGVAYRQLKRPEPAVTALRKSIQLNKRHQESYQILYEIMRDKNDNYESRAVVEDMIKVFGKKPRFLTYQCELLALDKFVDQGIEVCREAIAKDKAVASNHLFLARIHLIGKDIEAARKVFVAAAKKFPDDGLIQTATADFFFDQKNFPSAARYYRKAVEISPDVAKTQLGLARSYFELRKYEEALKYFLFACARDKEASAHFRSAMTRLTLAKQENWFKLYDEKAYQCR